MSLAATLSPLSLPMVDFAAQNAPHEPLKSETRFIEDVESAIRFFQEKDRTFEVRVLGYFTNPSYEHTLHGYFRDPKVAASCILANPAALMRAKGIFVSSNPITPDLYETCKDKLVKATEDCAKPEHTLKIKYFRVDIDPQRTSGVKNICSTDEELATVRKLSHEVERFLSAYSFGLPHRLLTGNGIQLIYETDLENSAANVALIKRFLAALDSKFSTPEARIDDGAFILPMLLRIPGTWNRKGGDSTERPNRKVRLEIAGAGDPARIVSREHIEAVAALAPAKPSRTAPTASMSERSGSENHRLLTDRYLSHYGVEYRVDNQDGLARYHLLRCLFNEDHDERGKVAILHAADHNYPIYQCFHASCGKIKWKALEDRIGKPLPEHFDPPKYRKKRGRPRKTPRAVQSQPLSPEEAAKQLDRRVVLNTKEHECIARAIERLTCDKGVYQRSGELVYILRPDDSVQSASDSQKTIRIASVPAAQLRTRLVECCDFVKAVERDEQDMQSGGDAAGVPVEEFIEQHPPRWLYEGVLHAESWPGIPSIFGFSEAPFLRPDGTLCKQYGYDKATGIFLDCPSDFVDVSHSPTREDAICAAHVLEELVCDFPFAEHFHRSAWLSGILSPLARLTHCGPSPWHLVDANVAGAGKGLLIKVIARVVTGRGLAMEPFTNDPQELSKKITAFAMDGRRIVCFDNLIGVVGNSAIDAALTASSWNDRILGQSKTTGDLPLLISWYGTGNNITLGADTSRRCLHIRLESKEERPEDRSDLVHVNLEGHVKTERSRYLSSALTILRAYCSAGCPDMNLKPWGSFEEWSAVVRSAIVWLGLPTFPDPLNSRIALTSESDSEGTLLRAIIAGLEEIDPSRNGMAIREMLGRVSKSDANACLAMKHALSLLPLKKDQQIEQALPLKLRSFRERRVGNKYLDRVLNRTGVATWRVAAD